MKNQIYRFFSIIYLQSFAAKNNTDGSVSLSYFCLPQMTGMKKILLLLVLALTLAVGAVYIFIPGTVQVSAATPVKAALPGVYRIMSEDGNWKKWWPADQLLQLNDRRYKIEGHIFNAFDISVIENNDSVNSRIDLAFITPDSLTLGWSAIINTGLNPFKRWKASNRTKQLEKDFSAILSSIKNHMEKTENIYGFPVRATTVVDSILISAKKEFTKKPGVTEIENLVGQLRQYISLNGAKTTNFPMLNVLAADENHYEVMVAIPVDRRLPATKDFAPKYMLAGGNILEAEVKGGPYTIEKAFGEFENFRSDHKFTSPAIPFQLMVTDRAKETDTAKWVTRLYYPIF